MDIFCHSGEGRNPDCKDRIISFSQRKKIIVSAIFLIGFSLCMSCCFSNCCFNDNGDILSKKDREALLTLVKAETAKEGIDINKFDIHISKEKGFVVVRLSQKDFKYDQYGGGGVRLFFKKDNNGYKFDGFEPIQ
jgi:hypothetical protein